VLIRSRPRQGDESSGWTVFSLFFPSELEKMLQSEALELQPSDVIEA
jgi:hypothetical protein